MDCFTISYFLFFSLLSVKKLKILAGQIVKQMKADGGETIMKEHAVSAEKNINIQLLLSQQEKKKM